MRRTPAEIYRYARQAGFGVVQAVTMTAIALAESGGDDAAVGDRGLQDSTWGPSVGLWQVRTLKAETGRGSDRDIVALQGNPGRQAAAAWAISGRGTDYTPWTVWNTGAYRQFLSQAQSAAGGDASGALPTPGGAVPTALPNPFAGSAAESAESARRLLLEVLAVGFGLALVGAALWLGTTRQVQRVRQRMIGALT